MLGRGSGARVWIVTTIDRTAYPRFKRVVPARELAEAFTPTVGEVAWARAKTQNEPHLLALVVWLKSYQRLGYLPKRYDVPPVVVEHVRGVLDLPVCGGEVRRGQGAAGPQGRRSARRSRRKTLRLT